MSQTLASAFLKAITDFFAYMVVWCHRLGTWANFGSGVSFTSIFKAESPLGMEYQESTQTNLYLMGIFHLNSIASCTGPEKGKKRNLW